MKIVQQQYKEGEWRYGDGSVERSDASFVLAFGARDIVKNPARFAEIRSFYPEAMIVMVSTAGEIFDTSVEDDTISLSALFFEKAFVRAYSQVITATEETGGAARKLGEKLETENLSHVLVFSDGLLVNGSDLANGVLAALPEGIAVTGGMAGDAALFEETYSGLNETPLRNNIIVIGLYGDVRVGHGLFGGWDSFGVPRIVTKSKNNVVYELDHQPILELYKKYLGEQAKDLPASGLLFPLSVRQPGGETEVVRTLLAVDEGEGSITYAGDVLEGSTAQLMKANFNRLIDGAEKAASLALDARTGPVDFALLVSCVGRKLVLKQRTEEEVEVVKHILGEGCAIAGFYSYGEIAPSASSGTFCELHNQTMTITTITELV